MPLQRPDGRRRRRRSCAVDATSAAGGLRFDPTEVDVYYFAPQKCLGLRRRPVARGRVARRHRAHRADRRRRTAGSRPRSTSASPSRTRRKDQTYNTPALATMFLAVQQVEWINEQRRPRVGRVRCDRSAETIYGWAEASSYATPFVADPAERSHVVATIDLDDRDRRHRRCRASCGPTGSSTPTSYRKLGRNQLRIAMFPAIEPDDVAALTKCIDHVVAR